ncbi:MAG: cytochrome b [Silicimonas sp.]|nr:cytochrome b [Silicimonas sp.]
MRLKSAVQTVAGIANGGVFAAGFGMMWNSHLGFGSLSKGLHWVGALLIIAMFGLGAAAVQYPLDTPEQMAAKWQFFAVHKTIGVCAFFYGALRLIFMLVQVKPQPLVQHGATEIFVARTVHWLLTLLMILVPLAGWVRHASLPGFAPLYLPFGDTLPFVPADPQLSEMASMVHFGFVVLLGLTVVLHISGAFKHHFWDRDDTLRRMLPGTRGETNVQSAAPLVLPLALALTFVAVVAWIAIANTPLV